MVAAGANGDRADRNLNAFTSPDSKATRKYTNKSASGTLLEAENFSISP